MTLKKMFFSIIILLSAMLLLFQEIIYTTTNEVIVLQQNELTEYTTKKIEETILNNLKTLKHVQSYMYNYMYNYMADINSIAYDDSQLSEKIYETKRLFSTPISYAVFSSDGVYDIPTDLTEKELENIKRCYDKFIINQANGLLSNYDFFVLDSNGYNNLYICDFYNVYKNKYDEIGRSYLATYAVCCKLNLQEITMTEQRFNNLDLKLVSPDSTYDLLSTKNNSKIVQSIDYKIPNTDYTLQGVLYSDSTINTTYQISKLAIFETVFLLILFIITIFLLERYVTSPTNKIISYIKKSNIVSSPKPLKMKSISEFKTIADYINSMIYENRNLARHIVKTQQQVYETEIDKYKSDLTFLENQINPHFLYNTLECVRSIAVINDISDIEEIMVLLSEIMRYSVKANNVVVFRDELDIINKYFDIMKIRFPYLSNIKINVDDEVLDSKVPKMILQPISENIFKHAISSNNSDLMIEIKAKAINNDIIITTTDNGRGISPERLEKIRSSLLQSQTDNSEKSIGLINVDRRIKLYCGNQYGIEIDSKLNEYTTVTIKICKTN